MKLNPTRYSSAVGEIWVMATFKLKYCHKVFRFAYFRQVCQALFEEAMQKYEIRYRCGFLGPVQLILLKHLQAINWKAFGVIVDFLSMA